jgi:hypothetical protein
MSVTTSDIRILYLIALIALLAGCVSPMPMQEQIPKLDYTNNEKVLISVIDKRKRVQEGKPKDFVGVAHGVFGIPVDWHVKQVLATEEGEKELDLSSWLVLRIVNGFNSEGWQSKSIDLDSLPSVDDATRELLKEDSSWLIILVLNEWYFSINLNWVSAFNFDTDSDIHVFHVNDGEVLYKNIKERDVVDEKASESPQNTILGAYKAQLQQIFNDADLQSVLGPVNTNQ